MCVHCLKYFDGKSYDSLSTKGMYKLGHIILINTFLEIRTLS